MRIPVTLPLRRAQTSALAFARTRGMPCGSTPGRLRLPAAPGPSPSLRLLPALQARFLHASPRSNFTCSPVSPAPPFIPDGPKKDTARSIALLDTVYPTDTSTNLPPTLLPHLTRRLHLIPNHPLAITRTLIESQFPPDLYPRHNTLSPIVSTYQNFDSLGFPAEHPGRSKTDTYYVNKSHVLRTHTSAHQAELFARGEKAFLVSADVYRRDAVDRSHYPVFHQMEGARAWEVREILDAGEGQGIYKEIQELEEKVRKSGVLVVEDEVVEKGGADGSGTWHDDLTNPLQEEHKGMEKAVRAVGTHLKRSLEGMVVALFQGQNSKTGDKLTVRWTESEFPFTSPSWELELLWDPTASSAPAAAAAEINPLQKQWLELLGCGVIKHPILHPDPEPGALPTRLGWAFGLGLERLSMALFSIPDIRLFWSQDQRFLSQFTAPNITTFKPYSKYPASPRDIAFWLPDPITMRGSPAAGGTMPPPEEIHENDVMEVVRGAVGDMAEDVRLVDEFVHPRTGRKSMCYRVVYRSLERTLTTAEVNELHDGLKRELRRALGVEIR